MSEQERIKKARHGSCTNAYHAPYIDELESERDRLKAQLNKTPHEYVGMGHCHECAMQLVVALTEGRDRLKARLEEAALLLSEVGRVTVNQGWWEKKEEWLANRDPHQWSAHPDGDTVCQRCHQVRGFQSAECVNRDKEAKSDPR